MARHKHSRIGEGRERGSARISRSGVEEERDQGLSMDIREEEREDSDLQRMELLSGDDGREVKDKCTNVDPRTINKEMVVYRSGKPVLVTNRSEIGREVNVISKDRFDNTHRGECVVTAILNDENCTTRGQTNFLKIIDAISLFNHPLD